VSKSNDKSLVIPGESGWEIWTQQEGGQFARQQATDHMRCGDLEDLPAGELTLLFSAKAFTAIPMRVASEDETLFEDLATMHAERLGIRPDPMAGQLSDVFVVDRGSENTALLAVYLRAPQMGELPLKSPNGFDLSARCYPIEGTPITVWKELGRWVFAIYRDGKLIYCQATSNDAAQPDAGLAREIKIALMQLSLQDMAIEPRRIVVWGDDEQVDLSALKAVFQAPVECEPKPTPVLPDPLSKLLPEDVRAARNEAIKRRNIIAGIAAGVVVYLAVVAWLGYGVWQKSADINELTQLADEIAPERVDYEQHMKQWDELQLAIDENYWPVDILDRIHECIPPNSGLRLKSAEVSGYSIKLNGEAPSLKAANDFSFKLSKHNGLARLRWELPPANSSSRGYSFRYTADVPQGIPQP